MIHCIFENGNKALLRHVVVDVLVIKNDKLLMVKRAEQLLEGGKWALVGGYVDRDETTRSAVKREIMEETGYEVHNISILWLNDNPERRNEDRQNISFVFYCESGEKIGTSDWEVEEQKWFAFDNLPPDDQIAFDHKKSIVKYLQMKRGEKIPLFEG